MVFWSFTRGSPQKLAWGIGNQIFWSYVCFRCIFRKCVLHTGLAKNSPKRYQTQNVWIFSIGQWFYQFRHANSMQKTSQMHSNTFLTCFEGPQGQKIGFRDLGPENKVQGLLNLVRQQYGSPLYPCAQRCNVPYPSIWYPQAQ